MPWTFAHPAAVLPLRRLADAGYLSFPALLVGCITPDVVYHVGRWDLGRLTHTPLGVLLVDVPTGALLLWCCSLLQMPIAGLLPEPHRSVLVGVRFGDPHSRGAAITALSLAIGASTHLFWDAFTHQTGYFVSVFAWLGWPVPFPGQEMRIYTLLQHGGSLAGVAALVIAYRRICARMVANRSSREANSPSRGRLGFGWLLAMLGLAAAVALPIACGAATSAAGEVNLHMLLVRQVAYSTSVFAVLVVLVAAIRVGRLARRRTRIAALVAPPDIQ